jgi:hypothetical protein
MSDKLTPKEKVEVVVYGLGFIRTVWGWIKEARDKRKLKKQNESTN